MGSKITYEIQVKDRWGKNLNQSGQALISLTGIYTHATLYDPDNDFASLANPVTITRGRLRFAIDTGVLGIASVSSNPGVDIYGIMATGHGFQSYNMKPGDPWVVRIDTAAQHTQVIVPFSFAQGTVASVVDTGLNFIPGMLIDPWPFVDVKTLNAAITLDVGLLASESGGNASGFLAAISIAALGPVRPKYAPTATAGALLQESNATTPAVLTPRPHLINATAVSLVWTISAGATLGNGRIIIPARNAVTGF